jgi:DNA polymerase I-like protein with 3'-5' exonuclease and polymerase domains
LVPVLRDTLLDRLRAEGLEPCYDQLRGTLLAVARLETNGMPFDADAHGARLVEWRGQLADARADLNRLLGTGVDPDKPEQIRDALRAVLSAEEIASWPTTRKTRLLSTEASAFEARPDLPVSGPLLRHRKYSKLVSAFGDKLASFIDPVTGCIHAEFHLTRTDTGRMACSSPALQAVPRDNEFRELFRAPTGRIIKADYSQIEILISAQIALENVILDAHARGADLHNLTAALLLNVPPDEVSKEQRQLAKAINFSLLYGGGAKNLMEAASAKYAIQMTEQEAQQFRRDFFTAYPRLRAFQQESVKTAKRLGFVRTKGGRVRRFGAKDNVHTMAGNAIVQGTGAALIQRALALVVRRLAHEDIKAQLTHVVHDEIVIWASDDAVEAARAVLVKAMEDAWLELFPGASTRNLVQCTVGRSWGASE